MHRSNCIRYERYICSFRLESNLKSHQKAFSFVLNIINGLANHNHQPGKYVALYTRPFKEAIHYLPSVFQKKKYPGYRIPQDFPKLVKSLSINAMEKKTNSKDTQTKLKFFYDQIKDSIKQYGDKSHKMCFSGTCVKVIFLYHF